MEIIPAINTNDTEEALTTLKKLSDIILPHGFPLEKVQIDINDGTFENIKTITPEDLYNVETELKLDFHLMVADPVGWIDRCARANASRIICQIEKIPDQLQYCEKIKEWGLGVGLALNIDTDIQEINPEILPNLDVVLLMSYPAGAGGKDLNTKVYGKIEQLVNLKKRQQYNFRICIDGGVKEDNIKNIKLLGADEVAMTNRILKGDIEENLEKYYKSMY